MAAIPRFLLPQRGPLWQRQQRTFAVHSLPFPSSSSAAATRPQRPADCAAAAARQQIRRASARQSKASSASSSSSPAKSKPPPPSPAPSNILEQPAKFNPPSHGARLPRSRGGANSAVPASQHYGGDLSAAERAAQRVRQYPGMMAPPGTWAHWFWTSRALHMTVTMSTLTALALYTLFENLRRTSPYADMLPTADELARHPVRSLRTAAEVWRLTEQHKANAIAERRQRRVDDVAKRTLYRKAHGLDETVGFGSSGGWFGGGGDGKKREGPTAPARNEPDPAAAVVDDASPIRGATPVAAAAVEDAAVAAAAADTEKRKKFMGIF